MDIRCSKCRNEYNSLYYDFHSCINIDYIKWITNFIQKLFSKISKHAILLLLISILITYGLSKIDEYRNNQLIKELLIEEIKENLTIINQNIYFDKFSGQNWGEYPRLFADIKTYTALLNSVKMVIFNSEQRKALLYLNRALSNMNIRISTNSEEAEKSAHKYFQSTLENGRYHTMQILNYLGKNQLYKEFELKGLENNLPEEYQGKTLEIYNDIQ